MDESVESTKRQIRTLINEITDLSKTDCGPNEYYPAVLQRIIAALAAPGGAIWLLESSGLRRSYQIQAQPEELNRNDEDSKRHNRLLTQVMHQGKPELIAASSVFGDKEQLANPTPYLLVLAPLMAASRPVGIIEIYQRPDSQIEAQRGYLRFIEHIAKLIADWLKGHAFQEVSSRQQLWQQADEFARLVHNSLDLRDTAFTIANEGRRLIQCDRVGVAVVKRNKAKLVSISGQDTIESRSNEVHAMNKLMTRVIRSKEPLWYDGTTEELPPQIEEAVEDYVDLSHGRTVTVLPILEPEKAIEGDVMADRDAIDQRRRSRRIIGAIIVDQIETQLSRSELEGRVDLVYEHACRAMSNSIQHSGIIMMPVLKVLDRTTWFFRGSALPRTLAILGAITLAIVALCTVQIDFDMEAKGSLKPTVDRNVYALVDGEIEGVLIDQGAKVTAGQPLVKLKNPQLEAEYQKLLGDLNATQKHFESSTHGLYTGNLSEAERRQRITENAGDEQKIASIRTQLEILEQQRARLVCTSPIDGIITTWDVEKTLRSRPVTTGQILMNVASFNDGWELEAKMPEKRMKHVDAAFADAAESGKDYLPVDFILKSHPESTLTGKLYRSGVHQQAELNGDEGTIVKLRVIPDSLEGISELPGAEVTVDVKCGKAPAGYAWFHEIPEWIRANVIF
jgi:hypothetical protein